MNLEPAKTCRSASYAHKSRLIFGVFGVLFCGGIAARADDGSLGPTTILKTQNYALCAGAVSFVFDNVAYAKCQIKNGNSVSLTLSYPPVTLPGQPSVIIDAAGNIQTVNAEGNKQGAFMASTYSPPIEATSPPPVGTEAIYTCTAGSAGSYAQCDGGICFKNTAGKSFPGLGMVSSSEIVCSCPVETPGQSAFSGYQVIGPYPCLPRTNYNLLCNAPARNGSTLYIGAPIGVYKALALALNNIPANFNECHPPLGGKGDQ
jgi:hypothetical protein